MTYKLTYFDARGRAELTRLIFHAAGVNFVDERIKESDWPTEKSNAPLGQLPYLTVLGQKLPQSKTIARYIAHQHNLAGHSGLEQVQADVVVDTSLELLDLYIDQVLHAKEDKAEAKAKFLSSTELKTHLDRIEKIIGLFGSNGFSVGSSLKWSDLAIFDSTSNILELNSNALDNYKKIKEVRKSVEENQRVSGYLKYRPTTAF